MIFAATALAFDVVDEPRWAERLTLPAGAGEWRVEQGLVFPVVDDDGAPAGFAVVGPGAASFAFAAPGESWWFAALLDPAAVGGDSTSRCRSARAPATRRCGACPPRTCATAACRTAGRTGLPSRRVAGIAEDAWLVQSAVLFDAYADLAGR